MALVSWPRQQVQISLSQASQVYIITLYVDKYIGMVVPCLQKIGGKGYFFQNNVCAV